MTLHFLRPYSLLLLLGWIPLAIQLYRYHNHAHTWREVCDPRLLTHLLVRRSGQGKMGLFFGCALLFWLLLVLALAGPSFHRAIAPTYRVPHACVFVLDMSDVMQTTDIQPSRLIRARYKLLDLLNRSQDAQTALVVFTGEPFVVSPLTDDAHTIAAMVSSLTPDIMPIGGSDMSLALKQAADLLKQGEATRGDIILLTASTPSPAAVATAKTLAAEGYRLSILGMGTVSGGPLPSAEGFSHKADGSIELARLNVFALSQLAVAGKGIFVPFSENNADIDNLLKTDRILRLRAAHHARAEIERFQDDGLFFVWVALLIALFAFRKGILEEISR